MNKKETVKDFNQLILGGKLAKDPVFDVADNGREYCSFSVVWHPGRPDASFFNGISWSKGGNDVLRNMKKGDDIHVTGQITQNRWIDDEGKKRQSVSIVPDFIADKRQHPEQDYNANSLILEGWVNSKNEVKTYGEDNKTVTNTSLAVGPKGNKSYFHITAFDKMGDYLAKATTSDKIRVVGNLKQDRWKDGEGTEKSAIKVIVEHMEYRNHSQKQEKASEKKKEIDEGMSR